MPRAAAPGAHPNGGTAELQPPPRHKEIKKKTDSLNRIVSVALRDLLFSQNQPLKWVYD
jgi:hypothetical protein